MAGNLERRGSAAMDSLHFDPFAYSSNTPRTPSPHDIHFVPDLHYKQPEPPIYDDDDQSYPQQTFYASRGSLLQELYDHDLAEQQQPIYEQPEQQQEWSQPQQYHMVRRATFPYVRHDQYPPYDYPPRPDVLYAEPISEGHEFIPHHEYDDNPSIKLEDTSASLMVPSQPGFYNRPPIAMSYLSPHTGLPVQHTDDAASKETQYLRRRCFNCHTTEPPSWRRSTLNPGKIVCNKCGLYERTHLRPRPLRFDELRAGNKARSNKTKGAVSPKAKLSLIKKEPREFGLVRRSSVSSSSSVHSGSGASDWDDNVSVYSSSGSGSAPPTSFNSPNTNTFPLDRDSQSPPRDGAIRLPNAPLSDLAAVSASPRASSISFYSPPGSAGNGAHDYYRRGSVSEQQPPQETTGWQTITASPPSAPIEIALPSEDALIDPSPVTAVPLTPMPIAIAAAS